MTTGNKLPVFAPEDPKVWFQQVEWALEDAIKPSSDQFRQLAKSLDAREAKEIRDMILNPPADKPFWSARTSAT